MAYWHTGPTRRTLAPHAYAPSMEPRMEHTVRIGPFDVGPRPGEGGMDTVYRGEHRNTGVPIAIEVIWRQADGDAR